MSKELLSIAKRLDWTQSDAWWTVLDSQSIGGTTYQAVTYWSSTNNLVIGIRTLPAGAWTMYHYNGTGGLPTIVPTANDAHQMAAIAIDSDGYLHVSYGMHDSPLLYRRSDAPVTSWTGGVTGALSMTGAVSTTVSYPRFFKDTLGKLYFMFRFGGSAVADWYIYQYATATTTWSGIAGTEVAYPGRITNGYLAHGNIGAYEFDPVFTSDWDGAGTGFLHWSFCWNDYPGGQFDVIHVRWNGSVFTKWTGAAQTMPMYPGNDTVVLNAGNGVVRGQGNAVLDADNRLHIILFYIAPSNNHELMHLWFTGTAWSSSVFTAWPPDINTSCPTDSLPYGDLVYSYCGMVFCHLSTNILHIIHGRRPGVTGTGLEKFSTVSGDFSTITSETFDTEDVDWAAIGYDKEFWRNNQELYYFYAAGRYKQCGGALTIDYPRLGHYAIGDPLVSGYSFGGII